MTLLLQPPFFCVFILFLYRQALQNQIEIKLNTGNMATDEFINNIIDALNKYTIDLAKAQIRIAFEQVGRIQGKKYATKKELAAKEIILKNSKDFNGSNTDVEVIKIAGISRNSYYKYKAELKEQQD